MGTEERSTAGRRRYVMRERAESVAATRERILRAAIRAALDLLTLDLTLDDVASRAGVSVQTVLRHFGSRDGLLDAATDLARADVLAERRVPAGDVPTALFAVVEHYERMGGLTLRLLGQAPVDARARTVTELGKAMHREWVRESFGHRFAGRSADESEALTDLLVVATDLYTWALLRQDRGLTREETERRMRALAEAVLAAGAGAVQHLDEIGNDDGHQAGRADRPAADKGSAR